MAGNIGKTLNFIQTLEENEQYEKAVDELLKLYQSVGDNLEIVKNLAMDYEVLKKTDDAIFWWEKYKTIDANDTISYSQLADLYYDKDRYQYYMNRAHIKVIEQKISQAADDFKKALSTAENEAATSKARFMLAVMYEAMKKNTDAIQEYLRLLETEESLNIYQRLVELYKLESDEDAIGLLETAIEKFPEETTFKEDIANLYYKTGDLQNALKYAQNDLTKAKIYLEKQENDEALKILNNAKVNKENAVKYHSLWAEYNYNLKEYDKALENLAELEKVAPNYPVLFQMRAMIYEAKNDEYMSHLCWAKCYELKGQVDLTVDELLLAHHSKPDDERAIMSLINVYTRQNDNNSVIEFCEKLHKLDEKNTFALKKLAEFYAGHGENLVALDFYEKLYVCDKSNMQNLKLLAQAYEKVRDAENAKKAWQKYLERAPIGEETESIKKKLQILENSDMAPEDSEGFLDKLLGFFRR